MQLVDKLFKSPVFKNLSILVSGTVVAQLIVIGFQVFLRRIYTPEDFGIFAVYMSLVGILATLSSLRYEQTIILPKDREQSWVLLILSAGISLLFSLILFIVIWIFNDWFLRLIGFSEKYSAWLFLLPFSVLIFSFSQALNFFLIRDKQFKISASNKVIRRSGEGIIQIISGLFKKSVGLIIGDFMGQLLVTLRSISKIKKGDAVHSFTYRESAKRYKSFPLKNGVPALMNALSLLLPVIIINRKFTEEVTGYFDLARMVLILPLSLITASLSQVLLQQFSEKRHKHQSIKKEAFSTFGFLLIFALLFGLFIQFFGPWIFGFVFGKPWIESGIYARILVWAFMLKFVISPFNITFTAFEKIGFLSIWQFMYFVLILLLYALSFKSIYNFLLLYLFIELFSYITAGIMSFYLIHSYEKKLL